jgi:hypothetical protein
MHQSFTVRTTALALAAVVSLSIVLPLGAFAAPSDLDPVPQTGATSWIANSPQPQGSRPSEAYLQQVQFSEGRVTVTSGTWAGQSWATATIGERPPAQAGPFGEVRAGGAPVSPAPSQAASSQEGVGTSSSERFFRSATAQRP